MRVNLLLFYSCRFIVFMFGLVTIYWDFSIWAGERIIYLIRSLTLTHTVADRANKQICLYTHTHLDFHSIKYLRWICSFFICFPYGFEWHIRIRHTRIKSTTFPHCERRHKCKDETTNLEVKVLYMWLCVAIDDDDDHCMHACVCVCVDVAC